jgi:hypothetical protein
MIKAAKITSWILFLVIGASAGTAWIIAPTFGFVFTAPAILLLLVQLIAFRCESTIADQFFAWTDLFYYITVGAVIGVGSIFLPQIDEVFSLDAEITYDNAKKQLPEAEKIAKNAAIVHQDFNKSLDNFSDKEIGDCVARQLAESASESFELYDRDDEISLLGSKAPPGCEFQILLLEGTARAWGEALVTENRVTDLREVVNREGLPLWTSEQFISPRTIQFLMLKLFPTLLLCGVILKVGKTTLAIRKCSPTD